MIQRIQSLYLLLVFILCMVIIFINPTFAQGTLNNVLNQVGYISNTVGATPTLKTLNLIVVIALGGGAISVLFLYKNLALQKKMVNYLIVVSLILIGLLVFDFYYMKNHMGTTSFYPGLNSIWSIACFVLLILARINVQKDIKLLASMDRIR